MTVASNEHYSPWQPCNAKDWKRIQLKHPFSIKLGKMLQNSPESTLDQEVPYLKAQHVQWDEVRLADLPTMWASPSDIHELSVKKGDLLVCEGGEVGRAAMVDEVPPRQTIIQNALHLVRANHGGDPRFLKYLLCHASSQNWFEVLCNKSTITHFTADKFGGMWVWLPESQRQNSIADFLDRETAQLDALIAAKERILVLLEEKRRALITRAVTRGIDSKVPMRDSGVPWLGEIPAHWATERSRWLFFPIDKRSETGEEELLTVSHLTGVTARSEKEVYMFEANSREGYKICQKGDLVINTLWAWMGAMGISPIAGIVSPDYHVYRPRKMLVSDYVDLIVRLNIFAQEVIRYSKGIWSSRLRLYPENFFEITFPVPPVEEQIKIVEHISSETEEIQILHDATRNTIALLKERRSALISAAVTGKLKVD